MSELNFKKALRFAEEKHEGQFRIGGEKYITHPAAVAEIVAEWGYGIEYQVTALFHDLLEDTDAKECEILALSNENVLNAVKLLTKSKPCNMADYVAKIRKNRIAFVVKTADRLHNLRSAFCTDEDFKKQYILESLKYYADFSPEIKKAAADLAKSMDKPVEVNNEE